MTNTLNPAQYTETSELDRFLDRMIRLFTVPADCRYTHARAAADVARVLSTARGYWSDYDDNQLIGVRQVIAAAITSHTDTADFWRDHAALAPSFDAAGAIDRAEKDRDLAHAERLAHASQMLARVLRRLETEFIPL